MKDELCAYEHDGLCMKGLAGTPCETEGCVARCSEQNVLTHQVTKTSDQEEPTSNDFEEEWSEYFRYKGSVATVNIKDLARHFANWQLERIVKALLSEVLPCFMHGGESDEVVAKLDEVLNNH